MSMSPTHLPRTSSNAVAEGNSEINGLGPPTDGDTQEDNAIQACHMERSSSSLMQQTLQRALLFRCKSDTGPVSTGPVSTVPVSTGPVQGEKTSEDEETKPCPPIHPSLGLPRPTGPGSTAPPLPPPDRSEQEQIPLYLEILPEESAASDVRRSTSLVTHKPEPPGPVHRTKSDPVPLFWKHAWFRLSLGQKAKLGAKLQKLHTSNRRPRPERPPPPNFTLNRGADRPPLQKEFTSGPSNGRGPPDGDSEAPPVDCASVYESVAPPVDCDSEYENSLKLSGEDEKKPCASLRLCRPVSPKSPNAPPPLPPTAGLDCSGSEPGDLHDYLVILPQESPTTQVSHLGRSTSFTLQPKPPAPMHHRTKSDSEPLSRKPAWFLLRLDQQKAKRGAKLQKRQTSDPPPRPERPPPPNFTPNRGADRPPLRKQTSTSGPSNGCDPQDPPVDCDSEYEKMFETKPCAPVLTRLSLSRPSGPGSSNAAPPLPPPAGLVHSASEPEPGPLNVEMLPEETAAAEVRPLERRTSLDTVKTNQPALVQRSKSASFPLLWKPARFQLSLDQQKANLGAKLQKRRHTCDQRRRPERPPPPNFTPNPGADRPSLQKQMSTSGSSDGDSGSPPVDCDPEYEDTLKVFGQAAEVAPGGLEHAPLYVEILPDQTTATEVSHLGRSTSFTLQPKPPAPMHHRTKSDSEPLSWKPAWFLLRLDQQKAKRGAKKPLHPSIRRPCPERPPPPTFTLNPGDDRPPLQKQMSTSGSSDDCDPQDGESTTPPVDCDSVYEDSLKFFEEAAESTSTKVSHLGRSTSLVTLKPKPPAPVQRTKSQPEPKPRTPAGLQLNLDQQKPKEGAKWQEPWHACDQRPRPERPPPPNYTLKRGADRPPLKKQMSTSGSADGCDPPDGDSGTPPVVHDSHYDSKSPPVSCEAQYDSKSPPVSCETQYDSKSPPVSCETQYDSKSPPVSCETQYDSKSPPVSSETQYDSKSPPVSSETQYDSKTPPVGCETQSEDRKTPPGAFVDGLKMSSPHSSASVPPVPPRMGLSDSVIGQGHVPPYLELTASTEAPTRKAVHDFFSKRPLPPVPHQQPQPEPLYEELTSCSCVTSGDSAERKPEDYEVLMAWWHTVDHWDNMPLDCELSEEEEMRVFALTAYRIKMGLRLFNCLLSRNGQSLQNLLTELDAAADGLDKTRKKAKMVTMTGGTTGAVGGVLTVAGLALAPMTLGASLVVSAVGVGVATAGGLTGASAAFSSKVNRNLDRKNVERIVLDYWDEVFDIERCLQFVNTAMEWLGRQDPARLTAADGETGAVVRLATVARSNRSSIQTADQSLEILWQFSQDIDEFFTSGEAQKLKKGTEKQFAERIRSLAQQLREGLDSLMRIREILSLAASTTGVYEDLSA